MPRVPFAAGCFCGSNNLNSLLLQNQQQGKRIQLFCVIHHLPADLVKVWRTLPAHTFFFRIFVRPVRSKMKTYYLHNGQEQQGPFSFEELKGKNLLPETPVWHAELSDWTRADALPELQRLFYNPPPYMPQKKKLRISPFLLIALVLLGSGAAGWLLSDRKDEKKAAANEAQLFRQQQMQEQKEKDSLAAEQKRRAEALARKNKQYRNRWMDYIRIGDTKPEIDDFWGGVDAFELPVKNDTEYMLDEVQVSISYIKKSGEVYKTEKVALYNIPPRSIETTKAPESSRGTSVTMKITKITARSFHFCYPAAGGNTQDPYYCQ